MNAQRRKALEKIEGLLSVARGLLDEIATEEHKAYASMPESMKNTEKGARAEEMASSLEIAVEGIDYLEAELAEARG